MTKPQKTQAPYTPKKGSLTFFDGTSIAQDGSSKDGSA